MNIETLLNLLIAEQEAVDKLWDYALYLLPKEQGIKVAVIIGEVLSAFRNAKSKLRYAIIENEKLKKSKGGNHA